jgi:hypothetical protein
MLWDKKNILGGTNEWVHSDLKYCSSCDVPTQNWEGINEKKKPTKANDDKLFSHAAIAMIAENALHNQNLAKKNAIESG